MSRYNGTLTLGRLTNTDIVEAPLNSGMAAVGRRIRDLALPEQALVTPIRRDDRVLIAHSETLLQPGDTLVVLAQRGTEDTLRRLLIGED